MLPEMGRDCLNILPGRFGERILTAFAGTHAFVPAMDLLPHALPNEFPGQRDSGECRKVWGGCWVGL